jgi:hypothetical protein
MQEKLKHEILKEGYLVQRKEVEDNLEQKANFVASQYQKELTDQLFKRVKAEEDHIRKSAGLLTMIDELLKALEEELQKERLARQTSMDLNAFYMSEANDYRDKYFNLMLKVNDNQSAEYLKQLRKTGQA